MKIECLLKRAGGSIVSIDSATYHFRPESGLFEDPHVAEVGDDDHIDLLMAIVPPAYLAVPFPMPIAAPSARTLTATPPTHPAPAAAGAVTTVSSPVAAKKPAKKAKAAPAAPVPEPAKEEAPVDPFAAMSDDDLLAAFVGIFGDPEPETTREEMVEALRAAPQQD